MSLRQRLYDVVRRLTGRGGDDSSIAAQGFVLPRGQYFITYLNWSLLFTVGCVALITARWSLAFISVLTLALTFLPFIFQSLAGVRIPSGFIAGIIIFTIATIFLGEFVDFYNRFWWWDVILHGGSAMGFGMIGFVIILMMFRGDHLSAPPALLALFAFGFAVSIGVIWEIFEFAMDLSFGLNMQKSGLFDTMGDLIVDCFGASVGASSGYFYLIGKRDGRFAATIKRFVDDNKRFFQRS